ncbi:ribosome-inactivating family protein [Streptomyces sp. CA-250714]|uniref:ribosome-inactivating family protein n=1 Tax=Streptomyces sp. CA-250714 TaxID=3240060 RepID=UPI003D8FEF25
MLAGTLSAGGTLTYGAQARAGQHAPAQVQAQGRPLSQSQSQPQPRAVGSDEEFANLYTHTIANIRRALRGDEAAQQPGTGYLIRNPDANAFQSINIGRLAERDNIHGGMVRALFRRSDTYLLGFYVEHGNRQTVYTFAEGDRDMIPAQVYPNADRSRFPFPVTYRDATRIQVGRGHLRNAVRTLFDHDPGPGNGRLRDHVETLAVALAEGARFQVIPRLIAEHIRGGQDWTVGDHENELHDWTDRSTVVANAHAADPSGDNGSVWRQPRRYDWNGARVLLTALDLARRIYLIKPPTRH